jgi:hypothetical protein
MAAVFNGAAGVAVLQPDQNPVIAMETSGSSSAEHSQELAVAQPPPPGQQRVKPQENVVNPGGQRQETVRRTASSVPAPVGEQRQDPPVERAEKIVESSEQSGLVSTAASTTSRDVKSLDVQSSSSGPPTPSSEPCSSPRTTVTTATLYPTEPRLN